MITANRLPKSGWLLALTLVGCSVEAKKPTVKMAEKAVMEQLTEKYGEGTFEMRDFRKTNGFSNIIDGREWYQIKYETDLYFADGINSQCANIGDKYIAECWDLTINFEPIIAKHHTLTQAGDVVFADSENGWVALKLKPIQ